MRYDHKKDELDRALKCALHENVKPDDALHQKVLYSWREERTMMDRKSYKIAAIVAATLIGATAIGSSVYAAVTGSSILSLLRDEGSNISQDAEKLVDAKPEIKLIGKHKQLEYINYSLDEIVCDEYMVHAQVTITPKDKDKYLLADDMFFDSDVDASELKIDGVSGISMTEYAKSIGKKLVFVHAALIPMSESQHYLESERYTRGENGELIYYVNKEIDKSDMYQEKLHIGEITNQHDSHAETSIITINNRSSLNNEAEYKTTDSTLDNGVTVERLSVITTEIGTYIAIEHASPEVVYPVFLDADGNEIEPLLSHSQGSTMHFSFGSLDMSKTFLGFQHIADKTGVGKIDGPYTIEKVKE